MSKIQEYISTQNYHPATENKLSESQLYQLHGELQNFYEEIVGRDGNTRKVLRDNKWLMSHGAMTPSGAIVVTNFRSAKYASNGHLIEPSDCDPIVYEQLTENLRQYKFWKKQKNIE